MVEIGYTLMGEQRSPKDMVRDLMAAERAGFDFAVVSDHYHPWLESQGHSPFTWSVLGAAAQATERIPLMTYVTCPIIRYHPAIVAQGAATMALLSGGRFSLGLGAGENLNEHVVGREWPPAHTRHEMLVEAVEIIRELWSGRWVTYHGEYLSVESAKLFDRPDQPPPIGIAASGPESCEIAGELADFLITVQPQPELVRTFSETGGEGKPVVGQLPVSWGPDEAKCRQLAREQARFNVLGWKVQSELPNPVNFDAATRFVREEDLAQQIPAGPDPAAIVEAVERFAQAGFTRVALLQIGEAQEEFCDFYARELSGALQRR
jgi:G6PDH family F420-dependent oxidoreductase